MKWITQYLFTMAKWTAENRFTQYTYNLNQYVFLPTQSSCMSSLLYSCWQRQSITRRTFCSLTRDWLFCGCQLIHEEGEVTSFTLRHSWQLWVSQDNVHVFLHFSFRFLEIPHLLLQEVIVGEYNLGFCLNPLKQWFPNCGTRISSGVLLQIVEVQNSKQHAAYDSKLIVKGK